MKWMDERQIKIELKKYLAKQKKDVSTSKTAARKLLIKLGLLTPKGNLKRWARPSSNVQR